MERIPVVLGLTFTMLSASILSFPSVNPDGYGAYPPPSNGDWVVTNDTIVENETIVLDGNLVVEDGGKLTLTNVTLKMNCIENGSYFIEVKDGGAMFIIDHSNITSNTLGGDHRYNFWVRRGAVFEMWDSELHECGYYVDYYIFETKGLYLEADSCIISDSFFSDNLDGITLNNSGFSNIKNCTFQGNTVGIDFNYGQNNSISNCLFLENGLGIYIWRTFNNSIKDCEFIDNGFGMHFTGYHTSIINNTFINNTYGIYEVNLGSVLRNNAIINSTKSFFLGEYGPENDIHFDIDSSNTIDGLPIICLSNQRDMVISPDTGFDNLGYLAVINCENITIKDLSIVANTHGMLLLNTSYSEVNNVNVMNNIRGIALVGSSNNLIHNCTIENNSNGMILWRDSNNNTIHNNLLVNNQPGIWFIHSFNNTFYHNNFITNDNHTNGGHDNNWYDGNNGGNFWDDYAGLDNGENNRSAGDGIGDTDLPHLGLDNFPFMERDGWLNYTPIDTDEDDIPDMIDTDDDNDGYNDTTELSEGTDPQSSASIPSDYDNDFIPDSTDSDIDNDGFPNEVDKYPFDENKWKEDEDLPITMLIGIVIIIIIVIGFGILVYKRKNTA